jgi:hypothetical protein
MEGLVKGEAINAWKFKNPTGKSNPKWYWQRKKLTPEWFTLR